MMEATIIFKDDLGNEVSVSVSYEIGIKFVKL